MKSGESDEALVRKAQQGSGEAYALLVERYSPQVLKTLYYLTGDRDEAEDLAQEVFLRVFRGLRGFRREASFRTWLYRIMHNIAASRLAYRQAEKRGGHLQFAGNEKAAEQPAGRSSDPAQPLMNEELRRAVEEAILSLEPDARELIVLRDIEDRSYEEISRALQLPVGTVKSRIHRARLLLRQRLKRYL